MAKGYIFACTNVSEKECFDRLLFGTGKLYGENVLQIKKGDILFLYNLDKDILYGIFYAQSDGSKNIVPEAWNGKYPYQVRVEKNEDVKFIKNAKRFLNKLGVSKNTLLSEEITLYICEYLKNPDGFDWEKIKKLKKEDLFEKPPLETTTLWDYPKQSYGKTPKGDNKYPGVTPAFIIYNLIKRYTEPGDLVVDPMAGSGTTLDVCREEGRRCICYDIAPTRPDVIQNDSRNIPLPDNSVDLIFVDSPYGDNIRYNDNPNCIGKISAEKEEFYDELEKVIRECHRILKPGKVIGWLIGDQWVKKKFTPVGFLVYQRMTKYFEPIDIICVARRNQTSNTPLWHNRAIRFNFFLRGFKYLFIMRKPDGKSDKNTPREVKWTFYSRERKKK
jgi:DNA modification methylase